MLEILCPSSICWGRLLLTGSGTGGKVVTVLLLLLPFHRRDINPRRSDTALNYTLRPPPPPPHLPPDALGGIRLMLVCVHGAGQICRSWGPTCGPPFFIEERRLALGLRRSRLHPWCWWERMCHSARDGWMVLEHVDGQCFVQASPPPPSQKRRDNNQNYLLQSTILVGKKTCLLYMRQDSW